jgi:CheY-like chemotaxis protein
MNGATRVLVVDDHVYLGENIVEILEGAGYEARTVASAEQALEALEANDVDALITDFRLPGLNGAELIIEIRRRGRHIPAVVMSAYSDDGTIAAARAAGAIDVLCKPVVISSLLALVGGMRVAHA